MIDFDHINHKLILVMPRVSQNEIDDRRRAMTLLLRDRAYLPVAELCRRFKISEATARRDLAALSRDRTIVRTFGGAMADYDRRFTPFADRLKLSADAKKKIAFAAAKMIEPGMTIFLDAGTTLFAVADLIRKKHRDLRVITNSLAVAERLSGAKSLEVDLLGGRLLANQSVLLGTETCRAVAFYKIDLALLGLEGLDRNGLWNSTDDVVTLQRAVVERAAHHAMCADASKLGQSAGAFLLPWSKVDLLITDASNQKILETCGQGAMKPAQVLAA